jgi:hypothetical protein
MTGGLITLRFALAIRPRPGFRLGLAAAIAAVVGAVLVLLRERLSGVVDPEVFVGLLGISAVLTGVLRVLGGFAAEERLGRRWTLGGIVLGTLEVGVGALLLLTSEVDPGLLVPIVAAWGAVSGRSVLAGRDPSDLSCKESTHQHAVDDPLLSCNSRLGVRVPRQLPKPQLTGLQCPGLHLHLHLRPPHPCGPVRVGAGPDSVRRLRPTVRA